MTDTLAGHVGAVLCQAVADSAARRPGDVAITDVDGGEVRYGELLPLVERLAAGLHAHGVRPGDTVAFALPNSARYVGLILAVARLGARYVPLMSDFTPEETARALELARPVLLVADRAHHAPADAVPTVPLAAVADGSTPPAPLPGRPHDGLFRQLWTSGSTGFPKMMVWRQDKFVAERLRWLADTRLGAGDVFYCRHPLDVAHATDLHVFAALLSGARLVLADPTASAAAHLRRLSDERATVMSALPSHYEALIRSAQETGGADLSALRRPLCGGAYLGPAVVRGAAEVLGIRIRQIYGSTEFGIALGNMTDEVQTSGAMVPVRGVGARIAALSDRAPDTGELVLRSDCTSEGYLFADEANARTFRGGEFWTGDVAQEVPGGGLRIIGRVTEVLSTPGGPVLAPVLDAEIAEECPGAEAVVLPVDPGEFTDRVVAVVRSVADGTADDVVKQVTGVLAGRGLSATVEVVPEIPRTPVGKIDKPRLRARFGLNANRTGG
ncbi:class I adenylate-forming enzyme family protein [Streptomyces sp. NPDC101166]|uniref:class I adenylate-forming enzyme family protein n=1 Tax=Streptomyces sp. NPDC101166 TaxID=3366120 RepID=UPI0037FDB97A